MLNNDVRPTNALVQARHDRLGEVLLGLRRRARLSQRELSRAAEISYTQISDLERGHGGNPSPLTLRALAKGLATDEFLDSGYDPQRADAFYRALMEAAGYLGGVPLGQARRGPTVEELREYLTKLTDDSAVADQMLALAERWADLDPADQAVAKRLLGMWTTPNRPTETG
jgi:transcriptional regulator with XRE-family HTH domain